MAASIKKPGRKIYIVRFDVERLYTNHRIKGLLGTYIRSPHASGIAFHVHTIYIPSLIASKTLCSSRTNTSCKSSKRLLRDLLSQKSTPSPISRRPQKMEVFEKASIYYPFDRADFEEFEIQRKEVCVSNFLNFLKFSRNIQC